MHSIVRPKIRIRHFYRDSGERRLSVGMREL